jgi:hypothetical protein
VWGIRTQRERLQSRGPSLLAIANCRCDCESEYECVYDRDCEHENHQKPKSKGISDVQGPVPSPHHHVQNTALIDNRTQHHREYDEKTNTADQASAW